jgi:hypothetical protein
VCKFTGQHIADDFHVAVAVGAESRTWLHSVLVDHPQWTELHMVRIKIVGE